MPYRSSFADVVYPDESDFPSAMQYRIAFTDTTNRLAVVHLIHTDFSFAKLADSAIVRDRILNRIVGNPCENPPTRRQGRTRVFRVCNRGRYRQLHSARKSIRVDPHKDRRLARPRKHLYSI
jgi:hypothetical protein